MGIQMLFRALICVSKVLLFCGFSLGRVPGERASELVILNPFVRYFQCLESKKKQKKQTRDCFQYVYQMHAIHFHIIYSSTHIQVVSSYRDRYFQRLKITDTAVTIGLDSQMPLVALFTGRSGYCLSP